MVFIHSFKLHPRNQVVLIIALAWSVLVFLSFYLNLRNFEHHSIRLATQQAVDLWNKDSAFRAWATLHGGVYVRPDERTPPNPLLEFLPQRDVVTTDGVKLTLMNPAYMMRQMTEEFEATYGIKGKITGQVLLDPKGVRNKADEWELAALKQFDQGKKEVIEIKQIEGEDYLRFMRPMIMTEGCTLCHGHLGFKDGDIRGGVSVAIPMGPFKQANEASRNLALLIHVVLWLLGVAAIFYIEMTKRRQSENDRRVDEVVNRAQKLDALGKLTGGIAHDYNNMLGIIIGYAELLKRSLTDQPKLAKYADGIYHAGQRGAKLTKKLLAFSRQKTSDAEPVDINNLLTELKQMLDKTLTARICLILDLADDLWLAYLDSGDLEDAIINISINAMHAMDGGGQLTIRSRNKRLGSRDAQLFNLSAGDYVELSLTDTGCGMDQAVIGRIFEPFFSTKGDKGTGLGLSQVYGFVERSQGAIKVYSEVGQGTEVRMLFPRYAAEDPIAEKSETTFQAAMGCEAILVVDDEMALLDLARELLAPQGYRVMCANSGKQALAILEQQSIELVLVDAIMPEMDGYQLAAIIREQHPKVKIQMISGFSDNRHRNKLDEQLYQEILYKPYQAQDLLTRVRTLLDQ